MPRCFSCDQLCVVPWTVACQLLSTGFSRKPTEVGCRVFPPGDLPKPGIKSQISCIGRQVLTLTRTPLKINGQRNYEELRSWEWTWSCAVRKHSKVLSKEVTYVCFKNMLTDEQKKRWVREEQKHKVSQLRSYRLVQVREDSLAYFNVAIYGSCQVVGIQCGLRHSLTMWFSASYCSSLVFGVLICKLEKRTVMTTHGCCRLIWIMHVKCLE